MLSIWTGESPGAAMARFLDLWTRWDERKTRWIPCDREHPDAVEDLNAIGEIVAKRWTVIGTLTERKRLLGQK